MHKIHQLTRQHFTYPNRYAPGSPFVSFPSLNVPVRMLVEKNARRCGAMTMSRTFTMLPVHRYIVQTRKQLANMLGKLYDINIDDFGA